MRRWWHRKRRRFDVWWLAWWMKGNAARERRNWFDLATMFAEHWTCDCGNAERLDRRSYIVNDLIWEERIRPR